MRLGSKTDDEFLIKLNEKNNQIQNIFHGKIEEIAKKYSVDVMMQDGTVKKQDTFDVEKFIRFMMNLLKNYRIGHWMEFQAPMMRALDEILSS